MKTPRPATKKNPTKLDVVLLIVFPALAVGLSLWLDVNFLVSTLLFFGIPSLWLAWRQPHQIPKTLLFSLIFSIPFTLIIDYVALRDLSWWMPNSILPWRLFDLIPLEDFLWGFLYVFCTISYYEYFIDHEEDQKLDRRVKYFAWVLVLAVAAFLLVLLTRPDFLQVPYAYFWIGLVAVVIPLITMLGFFPRLLSKYIKATVYFFCLTLMYELTALYLGTWTFPGENFIGWMSFGGLAMPLEEFIFWCILGACAVLSYYEFFGDDRR